MSERTRRTASKKQPHASFAELRKLRESGKTRLSTYEVEQEDDLYEEVDEDEYKKVVRDRLARDDFVVDDGGEGYVDNGMDDWGDEREMYESEEEMPTGKAAKRKREEDEQRKKRQEGDISRYFQAGATATAKPKKAPVNVDDTEFLGELLGEFESSMPDPAASTLSKKRRVEPTRKTKQRAVSPPRKASGFKLNGARQGAATDFGNRAAVTSSPPSLPAPAEDDDDDYGPPLALEDMDTAMSDAPVAPSSPTAKAVERRKVAPEPEEDDDDLAVAQVQGHTGVRERNVNISSSRPAKPATLPTPGTSSPVRASDVDSSMWTSVTQNLNVTTMPESAPMGKLAPQDAVEEDGSVKMFWMDYAEINGALMLFGKVMDKRTKRFVSAFLKVDGVMRNLFFLPREHKMRGTRETDEEVEMQDVHEEVSGIMEKHRITNFKAKSSSRKYAFELPGIPRESDYLKVLYPYYGTSQLNMDLEGETFSKVFGTNTGMFEQFVLCRNIMGPCWLKLEGVDFSAVRNASWCKLEMQVSKPQHVSILGDSDSTEAPPLTLMSIALRTMMNTKINKQEIISISCRIYENVSLDSTKTPEEMPCQVFTVVRSPNSTVFPAGFEKARERHPGNMRLEKSEGMLLNSFLAKLQIVDPDVLIGHELEGVDYSILLNRMKERKISNWSRIGRMKRTEWPRSNGRFAGSFFAERALVAGRLMCDLANDLGKSLMTKCQSWSLTEMCDLILASKRQDLDNEDVLKTWAKSGEGFLNYLMHAETDTFFIASIAIKIQMLPLTKILTNLAGNSWARTMSGTRAERNEYILLHEFYRNKYLCPDKVYDKQQKQMIKEEEELNPEEDGAAAAGKKKDKYKGGLVFEPEKGLYDKFILVMDFNSLYPSIIQEYNICFTTVDRTSEDEDKVPDVPENTEVLGILPKLIKTLVERRRQVKGLMKDKNATALQKTQWDIKQTALKLTANSMYGCLGYTRSRFYARPLAMLTTFKGREILQNTKDLAESMALQVIYGDTDSVMINTQADNHQDAIKIGNEFKKQVNDRYRKLEIDIDNVFERLLLHAKKKYAAINCTVVNGLLDRKMEVKGLDMRRREYCQLSKDASSHILNDVFSGDEKEVVVERIHDYLRELAENIREGKHPIKKYIIFTKLGKNPEEYPNGKTMPQVQVALRKKARGEQVRAGTVIPFIITTSSAPDSTGSDVHFAERAYTPQDVMKSDSGLKPDPEWYLIKQIFPPIERLCGPIDGTDSLRIAECLGLDTRKYQIVSSSGGTDAPELHPLESTIPDEERFADCTRLQVTCNRCREPFIWEGLATSVSLVTGSGLVCPNSACSQPIPTTALAAQVDSVIREHVTRYYDAWMVCNECGNRSRQISVYGKRCLGPQGRARGCKGIVAYEYTGRMLHNQIRYLASLWDADKARAMKGLSKEEREMVDARAELNRKRFEIVGGVVNKWLEKCGQGWVNMEVLFSFAAVQ